MRTWVRLPADRFVLHWPVGLRLLDDLTGEPPRGRVDAELFLDDAGTLVETGISAKLTPAGILTYPALGRRAKPSTHPPRDYQVRLTADYYIPLYRATAPGIAFQAFPYDDQTPPAGGPAGAVDTPLLPSPPYPFPPHVPVLRGEVTVTGDPTPDVLVSWTGAVGGTPVEDRTLTDARGTFALPLRWAPFGPLVQIDADYTPPGGPAQSGSVTVTLPGALATSQSIAIP